MTSEQTKREYAKQESGSQAPGWLKTAFGAAISLAVFSAFLLIGLSGVVKAGIKPSPFTPVVNKLGAVANILESDAERILKAMSSPPDDAEPSPALEGALNRLDAIAKQLVAADKIVRSVVEEVMGIEPSPFRLDVISALEAVQSVASITEQLGFEPCPFTDAVGTVQFSAQMIVINTTEYIQLIIGGMECPLITDPELCLPLCLWIPNDAGGYCDYDSTQELIN